VLLRVLRLLNISLVATTSSLLLPHITLLDSLDLLLLGIGDADHASAAVGAGKELAVLVVAASADLELAALLAFFAVHSDVAVLVFFVFVAGGDGTGYAGALCLLHALGDAGVVSQVLAVVLVQGAVTSGAA
jgi:hypothetical protein